MRVNFIYLCEKRTPEAVLQEIKDEEGGDSGSFDPVTESNVDELFVEADNFQDASKETLEKLRENIRNGRTYYFFSVHC